MTRYVVVKVNDYPTPASSAIADALAAAGINADVSVARQDRPKAQATAMPFDPAYEVRPPKPAPEAFTVTRVLGR